MAETCIHCGERLPLHWHGCASRTEDSVCPCALCREEREDATPAVIIRVVSAPRPEVEEPTETYSTTDGGAGCALTRAEVHTLVARILELAVGAESPLETVERLARLANAGGSTR